MRVLSDREHPDLKARRRVRHLARRWLDRQTGLIVDTETTGLGKLDQVIELAVIDIRGRCHYAQRFRPTIEIHPAAARVHGISHDDLERCPLAADCATEVRSVLDSGPILSYHAAFDHKLMVQTFGADVVPGPWFCLMDMARRWTGVERHQKLEGGNHSALGDCWAALRLLHLIAGTGETDALDAAPGTDYVQVPGAEW